MTKTSAKKPATQKTKGSASKKAPVKKKAPTNAAAPKKRSKKLAESPAPAKPASAPFREIKTWLCTQGQKVLVWSPALGVGPKNGYHEAKVVHVDPAAGSVLVFVRTDEITGRYLLPLDTTAAKVK